MQAKDPRTYSSRDKRGRVVIAFVVVHVESGQVDVRVRVLGLGEFEPEKGSINSAFNRNLSRLKLKAKDRGGSLRVERSLFSTQAGECRLIVDRD